MAKKKQPVQIIHVKKPIIGKKYYFNFAGGWEEGTLLNQADKLTATYGHRWFTFTNNRYGRDMKYPVSIYNIRTDNPIKKNKDV